MGEWHGVELTGLVLHAGRVTMRPWQPADAPAVASIMADPRMHDYLPVPDPYTASDAHDYTARFAPESAAEATGLHLAVAENTTGAVVGAVGLTLPGSGRGAAEIGYWTAPPHWGRGLATEAAGALTRFAHGVGLDRVVIRCDVRNVASAAVALRLGYRFEGVQRRGGPTPHGMTDHGVFARLADDPDGPVAPAWPALGERTDGTVSLRPMRPDDWPTQLAEETNAESRRWSLFPDGHTEADARRVCDRSGFEWLVGGPARMVIVDAATGAGAGTMMLRRVGPPNVAGIGYGVLPEFRGSGFTTRALRLITEWAFTETPIVRLELGCKVANRASATVAERAGFRREGLFAGRLADPTGGYDDEIAYGLTRPPD